jgi:hypothetical protein
MKAIVAALNNRIEPAGKASASVSAVRGARPSPASTSPGTPVTANSPVAIHPKALSSPFVAGSLADRNDIRAMDSHETTSSAPMISAALRTISEGLSSSGSAL